MLMVLFQDDRYRHKDTNSRRLITKEIVLKWALGILPSLLTWSMVYEAAYRLTFFIVFFFIRFLYMNTIPFFSAVFFIHLCILKLAHKTANRFKTKTISMFPSLKKNTHTHLFRMYHTIIKNIKMKTKIKRTLVNYFKNEKNQSY